jgi:outer membrane protein insertion porin family
MKRIPGIVLLLSIFFLETRGDVLDRTVVFGNVRTRDGVILREFRLKTGRPFTGPQMSKEKDWLLRLNRFRRVEIETRPAGLQDRKIMMVVVQEKSPWSFDPILSYDKPFGWIAGVRVSYNNLFGRQQRVAAQVQLGAVNHFVLSWQEPWFLGPARLFAETEMHLRRFRNVYGDHPAPFDEEDTGCSLSAGKQWGRHVRTGWTAGWEAVDVSDPAANASGKNREETVATGPFLLIDSRDWPAYPFSGCFVRLWRFQNTVASKNSFSRSGFDTRFFARIFTRHVIAFQAAGEISQGTVPVVRRLHIGGGKTLRGLSNGSLSGDNAVFSSLEYRVPVLFEKHEDTGFRFGYMAVFFADMGAAWDQDQVFKREWLRGSFGFGFHGILDRLVLRLEWGTRGKGAGFISTGTGVKF